MKRTKQSGAKEAKKIPLDKQIKKYVSTPSIPLQEYDGDSTQVIHTGSTLLDLAISGGRIRGGGIPLGILVEIFGPSGCGKTVLLCELAGFIQREGGSIMFHDPEARLNKQFARIFGMDSTDIHYTQPDTIPQVFDGVRKWKPKRFPNGIFADSLAALSTNMEMEGEDKMGMRRAKEFSEQLRKTCRIITSKNYLMVCSNQVRQNIDAGPYGQKYSSPGGNAIGFYSSLRLRCSSPKKITNEISIAGKKVKRVIGVETKVEVYKSSVWKPYRDAYLTILFDYGIDDTRQNLQFIKDYTRQSVYSIGGEKLHMSMDESIRMIEEDRLEKKLQEEVIDLWETIEAKFSSKRKPRIR